MIGGIVMKTKMIALVCAVLVCALPVIGNGARPSEDVYCFAQESELPDGVYLAAVPPASVGTLKLGTRTLQKGDVIPSSRLADVCLSPASQPTEDALVVYRAIESGKLAQETELKIPLLSRRNTAPVAKDGKLETYRNMTRDGKLLAEDEDGDALTYTITCAPKRGEVALNDDGTFRYTPIKNRVGRDTFKFTAADESGNVSNEATVTVEILKPSDKAEYIDMQGDPDAFEAAWLRERGLFSGETVAGNRCFSPDASVSRGDFLAMTMALLGAEPEENALQTGFADGGDAPSWMQPYMTTALQSGMIEGVRSERGVLFRPTAAITKAEAAVLLQNALRLPTSPQTEVFSADVIPVWAEQSMRALSCAGIELTPTFSAENLTRRDAAKLLRQVAEYLEANKDAQLPWLAS